MLLLQVSAEYEFYSDVSSEGSYATLRAATKEVYLKRRLYGEMGSHAGLKSRCRKASQFDPGGQQETTLL